MAKLKLLKMISLMSVLTFVFAFSNTALGATLQLQERYYVTYNANNGTADAEVDGQYFNSFTVIFLFPSITQIIFLLCKL